MSSQNDFLIENEQMLLLENCDYNIFQDVNYLFLVQWFKHQLTPV